MKFCIVLLFLVVVSSTAITLDEQWTAFKAEYKKVYTLSGEDDKRKSIFINNVVDVNEHNVRYNLGLETYEKGINEFSDLTFQEFSQSHLGGRGTPIKKAKYIEKPLKRMLSPDNFSWFNNGIPIKNQGACGSCWAFAAVAAVEYKYKLFHNDSYNLSEQEIVDCERKSHGCGGGWSDYALEYIRDNGISLEQDYKYRAIDGDCQADYVKKSQVNITTVCETPNNEVAYKNHLYQYGPMAVYYFVDPSFQHYRRGIYQSTKCNVGNGGINHAVLALGYGTQNGVDFWLMRNSWGKAFGEQGHFRIRRGVNMCNIGIHAAFYADIM